MKAVWIAMTLLLVALGCASASGPEPEAVDASECLPGCGEDSPQCEGWVRLVFDITDTGSTENARVVASCPLGQFDDAALDALSRWTYPSEVYGKRGVEVQLDFTPQ